jgi:hypothetical protein
MEPNGTKWNQMELLTTTCAPFLVNKSIKTDPWFSHYTALFWRLARTACGSDAGSLIRGKPILALIGRKNGLLA